MDEQKKQNQNNTRALKDSSESEKRKNNDQKIDFLLDLWYEESFDNEFIGKINLDKNEFVKRTKPGTFEDYLMQIREKDFAKISETVITLSPEEKSLQAVFWYNTGCLDQSNFQNGILDNSYRTDLRRSITKFNKEDGKIVVMMPGNLIGKEWKFDNLVDSFTKQATEWDENYKQEKVIRRLFYGLKKRKQRVVNDIKYALRCGADEVYLMKGEEEFIVLKATGYDVLEDVMKDLKSDPDFHKVKYIVEGTEAKINLVKQNGEGKSNYYNLIKLKHMKSSKSENPTNMEAGSQLRSVRPDAAFLCGGNFTAALKHENIYYPSGQLMYLNTVKGRNPKYMTNDGNVFQIIPEGTHNVAIVKGGQNLYDDDLSLIQKIYAEKRKIKVMNRILKEKLDEKIVKLEQTKVKISKGRDL